MAVHNGGGRGGDYPSLNGGNNGGGGDREGGGEGRVEVMVLCEAVVVRETGVGHQNRQRW